MSDDPIERAAREVDAERKDWHVIVKTYGGTVSMLRNLSLREAVEARSRLLPVHSNQLRVAMGGGGSFTVNPPSDIHSSWIIGPEGWVDRPKA